MTKLHRHPVLSKGIYRDGHDLTYFTCVGTVLLLEFLNVPVDYSGNAVDGRTSGHLETSPCSHTGKWGDVYWRVDLRVMAKITSVVVYHRDSFREFISRISKLLGLTLV